MSILILMIRCICSLLLIQTDLFVHSIQINLFSQISFQFTIYYYPEIFLAYLLQFQLKK